MDGLTIKRDDTGTLCFFMGGGDIVEHHCIVTGAMLREVDEKKLEAALLESGKGIASDDDRDMEMAG